MFVVCNESPGLAAQFLTASALSHVLCVTSASRAESLAFCNRPPAERRRAGGEAASYCAAFVCVCGRDGNYSTIIRHNTKLLLTVSAESFHVFITTFTPTWPECSKSRRRRGWRGHVIPSTHTHTHKVNTMKQVRVCV